MPAETSSAPHVRPLSATGPSAIRLRAGNAILDVTPELGGSITRYAGILAGQPLDWMRPADPAAIARHDPEAASCFPLVPFSNRVRDGRFRYGGVDAYIKPEPGPHAEHGHGWHRPWHVIERGESRLTIGFEMRDADWPFAYDAHQTFRLTANDLSVEIALANRSGIPMPAGIGLHPYFPRTKRSRLRARVDAMWRTDAEVMPTDLVPPDDGADPASGIEIDRTQLDNCFTGWNGEAAIEWPERATQLKMTAEPPLRFLVVYSPPGEPYFCAEPVSHCTDAFNLQAAGRTDTGTIHLEPGASVAATATFRPMPLPVH